MTEQQQNKTAQISSQTVNDLPISSDIMFSNHKNIYKRRIEKRQRKLLDKMSFLAPFLRDEKILLITTGCSPISFLEQMITGWMVVNLKRSLFIFTDKRIFHVPTKPNLAYRKSIAQILYADCRIISLKGSVLKVEYKNGEKEKFYYIAWSDRKKIKTLLANLPLQGQPSHAQRRIHLCPDCANPLVIGRYVCPACNLTFKDKARARKIALLYPGGGYFYTGHPFMGIMDAAAESILTILLIVALFDLINGVPDSLMRFLLITVILVFEKLASVHHSDSFTSEFIPAPGTAKPTPKMQSEFADLLQNSGSTNKS